jgi:hypothetical protein
MLSQKSPPRWHRIYYLLAMFDVGVVLLGLMLNHRITDAFYQSVQVNRTWDTHLSSYVLLGDLATEMNSPGNDVFASHDVPAGAGPPEAK